ncbi:MAG TPA: radical SAM protein [Dehalococcoidia bacterium]|nr:radical SAM protein [Dehalococcoidia bacterium]
MECKSVLNKSGLADYAVNCYAGCEHGCCYCYARFATRFSHPGEPWGSFVDVKVNAPQILSREVSRKRMGRVFVSSVCDGWQPSEAKYFLTRQCLEILLNHGYSITTLTKNVLAGRDLDLLASEAGVEFGVTITTLDENLRRIIEPSSSSSDGRLGLLQEAKRKGIKTYVFLGPLLPYLSDTEANLILLLKAVKEVDADYFYVDRLNPRFGLWPPLKSLLEEHFPDLITEYQQILFEELIRIKYSERLISKVSHLSRQQGLDGKMTLCF